MIAAAAIVMAVEPLAAYGEEGIARRRACACRWKCRDTPAGVWPNGRPPVAAIRSSVVHSRLMRHAPSSARCAPRHDRRTGRFPRRRSGLSHGPCRPRSARRPARAGQRRGGWRRARSPISIAPGAAARIAARISAAISVRGLSSVTMTMSASRVAISPMIGRLPRSRSPPAPNTTTTRPVVKGRSDASALSSASGLWA